MHRTIRFAIQIAVIAAVVVALPYKLFELDRYFVPKELVLNAAALIVTTALVVKRRSLQFDLVDGLIALFLGGPVRLIWRPPHTGYLEYGWHGAQLIAGNLYVLLGLLLLAMTAAFLGRRRLRPGP